MLADILEEGCLTCSCSSCQEEASVRTRYQVVCILHLLVGNVKNLFMIHVMFVLAYILVDISLLRTMS